MHNIDTLMATFDAINLLGDSKQFTEEDTRANIIDKILSDGLGWNHTNVRREVSIEEDRMDYVLNAGGIRVVIEAKRVGNSFVLPVGHGGPKRPISLRAVKKLGTDVGKSIDQATSYALENNIPIVVVTNGFQWILYSTLRKSGENINENKTIVFDSVDSCIKAAKYFWDMLSPEGVEAILISKIIDGPSITRSATFCEGISEKDFRFNRSDLQADLALLADDIFSDAMFQDRSFFHEHCYCMSGALAQFTNASREIINGQYSDEFKQTAGPLNIVQATTKKRG